MIYLQIFITRDWHVLASGHVCDWRWHDLVNHRMFCLWHHNPWLTYLMLQLLQNYCSPPRTEMSQQLTGCKDAEQQAAAHCMQQQVQHWCETLGAHAGLCLSSICRWYEYAVLDWLTDIEWSSLIAQSLYFAHALPNHRLSFMFYIYQARHTPIALLGSYTGKSACCSIDVQHHFTSLSLRNE